METQRQPSDTLTGSIGAIAGKLVITHELLRSLCGGVDPVACLVMPSVRCSILVSGRSYPSLKTAKAGSASLIENNPDDFLEITSQDGYEGCVRVVPVLGWHCKPRARSSLVTCSLRPRDPQA